MARRQEFAITSNMRQHAPKGVRAMKYYDKLERRMIYKVNLTRKQYNYMLEVSENVGGFIARFNQRQSEKM